MAGVRWLCVVTLCVTLTHAASDPPHYVEVQTSQGRVRGFREEVLGRDINVFYGIPFAEPPLHTLRFQRPRTKGAWEGTWDATRKPASCHQVKDTSFGSFYGVREWNPNTNMSEDCLYLNIWAPTSALSNPRAVLVWIYGGGFYGGTSTLDLYDGSIMAASEDVVVVSMQYRVGVLGFLYLGAASAPGNMGLVDQHMALQWVYNHIDSFGGNHRKLTLFGESAGAVSVSLHMVAPISQKIFNNAIMQSGSAVCRWATESRAAAKKRSLTLAKMFQCAADDGSVPDNEVIACLRRQDPVRLSIEMWSLQDEYNLVTPILATIDGYFLREHPVTSVQNGRIKESPVLLGGNKDEGSFFLVYGLSHLFYMSANESLPRDQYMEVLGLVSHSKNPLIHDIINFEYNVPQDLAQKELPRFVLDDMVGDSDFLCPTVHFGRAVAEGGQDVYMYHFMHRSSGNTWPSWMGVMHGYEIDHVFGLPLNESYTYNDAEKQLSRDMMQYWANFARYSNPNGDGGNEEWKPYTLQNKEYMTLEVGVKEMRMGLRNRACRFWDEILPAIKEAVNNPEPEEPGAVCGAGRHLASVSLVLVIVCLFGQHFFC